VKTRQHNIVEGGEAHTVWPSFDMSTSGWFGGSTSLVVPITGQDMMIVMVRRV
jgi:hypothetical protein